MGSYYINRTFFFDVHPPLGKVRGSMHLDPLLYTIQSGRLCQVFCVWLLTYTTIDADRSCWIPDGLWWHLSIHKTRGQIWAPQLHRNERGKPFSHFKYALLGCHSLGLNSNACDLPVLCSVLCSSWFMSASFCLPYCPGAVQFHPSSSCCGLSAYLW